MAYTIPDKGEGDNDIQSVFYQEDLDVFVAGIAGIDCVLSGLAVTGGADMTPAVAKGAVLSNRVMFAVAAADVTIGTADATNPRIDLIVVNSSGALAVRAGTAAAIPKPPVRTANDVVIARVYVPASDTSMETTKITDLRVTPKFPIIIYRTTTAEITNTESAAIEALNQANAGVTIPSGLFLAGRILRVRLGGNRLINSGSPTVRIAVVYGGTTMFSDISAAGTNNVNRGAWFLDFDITAQANNDQALSVHFFDLDRGGPAAPTTGIGSCWITSFAIGTFQGSAAVDSDTADRKLSVQITFSVADSNVELVVETATVELL